MHLFLLFKSVGQYILGKHKTSRYIPFSWRLRRPDHKPCIQDQDSLSWWTGMLSIPHWGQIWRVQHRPQTLAAGLWQPLYPWLHSADHNMKPTLTRPLPDGHITASLQCSQSPRSSFCYWRQEIYTYEWVGLHYYQLRKWSPKKQVLLYG